MKPVAWAVCCAVLALVAGCGPKRTPFAPAEPAAPPPVRRQAEQLGTQLAEAERASAGALAAAEEVRADLARLPADPPTGSLVPVRRAVAERLRPRVEESLASVRAARAAGGDVIAAALEAPALRRELADATDAQQGALRGRLLSLAVVAIAGAGLSALAGAALLVWAPGPLRRWSLAAFLAAAVCVVFFALFVTARAAVPWLSRWGVWVFGAAGLAGACALAYAIRANWSVIGTLVAGGQAAKDRAVEALRAALSEAGDDPGRIAEICARVREAFNRGHQAAQAAAADGTAEAVRRLKGEKRD
jgi:hypothetical protein